MECDKDMSLNEVQKFMHILDNCIINCDGKKLYIHLNEKGNFDEEFKNMIKIENYCYGCATDGGLYPCLGSTCPRRNVKIYECDICHDESENLYDYDGMELCLSCVEKRLDKLK